jgi:hypothetical protein
MGAELYVIEGGKQIPTVDGAALVASAPANISASHLNLLAVGAAHNGFEAAAANVGSTEIDMIKRRLAKIVAKGMLPLPFCHTNVVIWAADNICRGYKSHGAQDLLVHIHNEVITSGLSDRQKARDIRLSAYLMELVQRTKCSIAAVAADLAVIAVRCAQSKLSPPASAPR